MLPSAHLRKIQSAHLRSIHPALTGARSCVLHLDRSRTRLGAWIDKLEQRMHTNKVVVALANKIARIAWVVLNRPGTLYAFG